MLDEDSLHTYLAERDRNGEMSHHDVSSALVEAVIDAWSPLLTKSSDD